MKAVVASSVVALALAVSANAAKAADYETDRAIQDLVVSGVVESWTGVTFISNPEGNVEPDQDEFLASGLSGRLSLPLGENLSIQSDVDFEYGSTAFSGEFSSDTFEYALQFGAHLSWRDPSRGLFGAFGGFGAGRGDDNTDGGQEDPNTQNTQFWFVGGEGQYYTEDLTFYLQAGFMDSEDDEFPGDGNDAFRDAAFVRGVGRWFISPNTRLQLEAAFADGKTDNENSNDAQIIEWGVRFDTVLEGLPVIGDTAVFVGYRGNHYRRDLQADDDEEEDTKYTDHTIMVGTSYHFGGTTRKEFERTGAGLDLPNFGRWSAAGENID
ncbi:hypothetical protein [Anderseniella sp. Alg231-50]|uniref:hypothetical protein n=1 Tax=Anderseniella sp. Alg231-50 TaxID=1922226 RepID=UPI000D54DA39